VDAFDVGTLASRVYRLSTGQGMKPIINALTVDFEDWYQGLEI
jgi:hypothetical protein